MSKKPGISLTFAALLLLSSSGISTAQVTMSTASNSTSVDNFSQFIPHPQKKTKIDYEMWDSLLEEMVLYTGPSTRKRPSRPRPITGSRFSRGHTSSYRLEGNRIPYSEIKPAFKDAITEYRQDLERIGTQIEISKLSRNEQLAFWFNLHNVVIIEQLAEEYPIRRPRDLKIGKPKIKLHDAKIINIGNHKLSLRDIREKIIYPNWRDPKVIYGFYLGDIGSPSIQNSAFNATNVSSILERSASEFTNSLRGFHTRNNSQYVSQIYAEVAPFYFPNFHQDLANHLEKFMRSDVKTELNKTGLFQIDDYETVIADMTGGRGNFESISILRSNTGYGAFEGNVSTFQQYVKELVAKRRELERSGLVGTGTVVIEDIETTDSSDNFELDIDLEP